VYKGQRKFIRIGYIGINPVSSLPPIWLNCQTISGI
jgi:hypothetical protein